VFDESLWKLLSRNNPENACAMIWMPRKPCENGVLCYSLGVFLKECDQPYIAAVYPLVQGATHADPGSCLIQALNLFENSTGHFTKPTIIGDSAFSSDLTRETLRSMEYTYILSAKGAKGGKNMPWSAAHQSLTLNDSGILEFSETGELFIAITFGIAFMVAV
jgi:hypothetical protein